MPRLSAAEKQRRYRARRDADPAKREAYLAKGRQKTGSKVHTISPYLNRVRGKNVQRERPGEEPRNRADVERNRLLLLLSDTCC